MTDPTPNTPFTVRDRIQWLEQQVENLISALRGTPAEDLHTIVEGLYTQTNPRHPYLVSVNSRLAEIEERLDKLQAGVGAVPYNDLELTSVRGLLYALLQGQNRQLFGVPPISSVDANISDGDFVQNGRRYATFNGPIQGVSIANNKIDLTANWNGWKYYIQTTDPAPWVGTDVTSPNSWLDMPTGQTYNFSANAAYPIKAFLQVDNDIVGAYSFLTEPYVLVGNVGYGIVANGVPGFETHISDASGYGDASKAIYWYANVSYEARLIDAANNVLLGYKTGPTQPWTFTTLTTEYQSFPPNFRHFVSAPAAGIGVYIRLVS